MFNVSLMIDNVQWYIRLNNNIVVHVSKYTHTHTHEICTICFRNLQGRIDIYFLLEYLSELKWKNGRLIPTIPYRILWMSHKKWTNGQKHIGPLWRYPKESAGNGSTIESPVWAPAYAPLRPCAHRAHHLCCGCKRLYLTYQGCKRVTMMI